MDFVENGSDNLHFRIVHLWEYSKIYNHQVNSDTITLEQDTRFHFGSCSTSALTRFMSRVLPELELKQEHVYHGPGLAIVGAENTSLTLSNGGRPSTLVTTKHLKKSLKPTAKNNGGLSPN